MTNLAFIAMRSTGDQVYSPNLVEGFFSEVRIQQYGDSGALRALTQHSTALNNV